MHREEKSAMVGPSAREILAAWVCCGLIGVGGVLLDAATPGRSKTQAAYAGIQLPGTGRSVSADRSIADEFADLRDLPGDDTVDLAAAKESTDAPVKTQQCWLRSVVHRLL